MTAVKVSAVCGNPYLISAHPEGITLGRHSTNGRQNNIEFRHADAIKICNTIIDMIEESDTK